MPVPSDTPQLLQRALYINDFDPTRLGFVLGNVVDNLRSGLSFPDRTTNLPGRVGTIALARTFESAPRMLTIEGTLQATSAAQLDANNDALKARCYDGLVQLRFSDNYEKEYLAYCQGYNVSRPNPVLPRGGRIFTMTVRLQMLCQDPLAYDRQGSVIGLSTSPQQVPLGNAPSQPQLTVSGPTTVGLQLVYKDHMGVQQATIQLSSTLTLDSTQMAIIDCELSTIYTSTGKNLVGGLSTDSTFFALDFQDGGGSTGPWPTVEISSPAGAVGQALYKRAYL